MLSSAEYYGFGEEYCLFGQFWLKAPRTGAHKILLAGDDYLELWFNKNAGVPTIDYSDATTNVAFIRGASGFRNYYRYAENTSHKPISDDLNLEEGKLYATEFYLCQGGGSDYFSIAL